MGWGGLVLEWASEFGGDIQGVAPRLAAGGSSGPPPAGKYLALAAESSSAPAASVLLSAAAVDAMLKMHAYAEGELLARIDQAADDGLITAELAGWSRPSQARAKATASTARPLAFTSGATEPCQSTTVPKTSKAITLILSATSFMTA